MSDTFGTPGAMVSLFAKCATNSKSGDATLDEVIASIYRGDYRQVVNELRAANESDKGKIKAHKIPAFTPVGTFKDNHTVADFKEPSGYYVLDFDDVDNPEQYRDELAQFPFVAVAFVSPSGNGVKALVRIERITSNQESHKIFAHLSNYFKKAGLKVKADPSGKDVSRLCLLSYDPHLYQNPTPRVFRAEDHPLDSIDELSNAVKDAVKDAVKEGRDDPGTTPTAQTREAALRHVRNVIKKGAELKDEGESRHDWMRSACNIGWQYVLGGHVNEAETLAVISDEYGAMFPGDIERMKAVERAWQGGQKIAQQKGALHPSTTDTTWNLPASPEDVTPERIAELFKMAFAPSWANKPPDVPDLIKLDTHGIGRSGSITMVMAGTKQGKSTVCGAIYASAINPDIDPLDSLGFTITLPEDKPGVIYFDTEQSDDETWKSWERAITRAGFKYGEPLPEHVDNTHICLTAITSHVDRQAMILHVLESMDGVGLVIIDGLADLVANPNDLEESAAVLDKIRGLASTRRVCVVITLHTNPSPDGKQTKARGHLGSDALRRARSYIRVTKNAATQIHAITIEGNRGGMDNVSTYFRWDDDKYRHVKCDKDDIPVESSSTVKLRNTFDEAMGAIAWKHGDLVRKIQQTTGKSEATAKALIRQAKAAGLLELNLKQYRFIRTGSNAEQYDDETLF